MAVMMPIDAWCCSRSEPDENIVDAVVFDVDVFVFVVVLVSVQAVLDIRPRTLDVKVQQ